MVHFTSNPWVCVELMHYDAGKTSLSRGEPLPSDTQIWFVSHEIQICDYFSPALLTPSTHSHTPQSQPWPCLSLSSSPHQYPSAGCQKERYSQELFCFPAPPCSSFQHVWIFSVWSALLNKTNAIRNSWLLCAINKWLVCGASQWLIGCAWDVLEPDSVSAKRTRWGISKLISAWPTSAVCAREFRSWQWMQFIYFYMSLLFSCRTFARGAQSWIFMADFDSDFFTSKWPNGWFFLGHFSFFHSVGKRH